MSESVHDTPSLTSSKITDHDDFEKNFDLQVRNLFSLIDDIEQNNVGNEMQLKSVKSNESMVYKYFKNYEKSYEVAEEAEQTYTHQKYFLKAFRENRNAILCEKKDADKNWISEGLNPVQVIFEDHGSGKNPIKLVITKFYRMAKNMGADNLNYASNSLRGRTEVLLPGKFLLCMYRIFYNCKIAENDRDKLRRKIKKLEKDITKIEEKYRDDDDEDDDTDSDVETTKRSAKSSGFEAGNNPLEPLMKAVGPMMKNMGLDIPEGQNMPSSEKMGELLNNFMKSDLTKNLMENMANTVKDNPDVKKSVQQMAENIGSPQAVEELQNITSNTLDGKRISPSSSSSRDSSDSSVLPSSQNLLRYEDATDGRVVEDAYNSDEEITF